MTPDYAAAAGMIRESRSPSVFTGAGMSRDSGLRTFRGEDGLWRDRRAEELATPGALADCPALVWEWYRERLAALGGVEPHAGYHALVAIERMAGALPVVTQNIDGLHRAAGSSRVVELHGSMRTASCTRRCGFRCGIGEALASGSPPRCGCGAVLRPDVVMFGEPLPEGAMEEALDIAGSTDLMIVVGTSLVVHPAAAVPAAALSAGARIIEVNTGRTALSGLAGVLHIAAGAAQALPRLAGAT